MTQIKFCKIRNVKTPSRGTLQSAGIDFYIPEDLTVTQIAEAYEKIKKYNRQLPSFSINDKGYITKFFIKSGDCLFIPSGIRCILPTGYMLKFDNKSGIATKQGLLVGANIVDEDYREECHLHLINVTKSVIEIEAGTKICQGIVIPVEYSELCEISQYEIDNNKTERHGGFGSTGIK